MAQLDVEPRKSNNWWLWLLLALLALGLIWWLTRSCDKKNVGITDSGHRDSAMTTGMTDSNRTGMTTDTANKGTAVGTTEPDYANVDFNSPETRLTEITGNNVKVRGTDKYTIYSLGENILFAKDASAIQGGAQADLKQIAASIDKSFKNAKVAVYGNTDSDGSAEHNKELGKQRANAVKDWLVNEAKMDASRVTVQSHGENKPVATNATAEGKAQNRNVEIVVFK